MCDEIELDRSLLSRLFITTHGMLQRLNVVPVVGLMPKQNYRGPMINREENLDRIVLIQPPLELDNNVQILTQTDCQTKCMPALLSVAGEKTFNFCEISD